MEEQSQTPAPGPEMTVTPENPLKKNLFPKIVKIWQSLPLKFKLPIFIFSGLFIVLALFLILFKPHQLNKDSSGNMSLLPDFSNWKKLVIPQKESPFFTLKPKNNSKYGVLPKETYILKTKEPFKAENVKSYLAVSAPVNVVSVNDSEFAITPQSPLGQGQTLKIKLAVADKEVNGHAFDRDYSWAYQSQGKFRVVSTIPGDKKNDVPINSGIEIVLSQDDYADPQKLLSIEPAIDFKVERHGETIALVPQTGLSPMTSYTITLKKGLNLQSRSDPLQEDYSFSFQTAAPPETQKQASVLNIADTFLQVSPDDPVQIQTWAYNWDNNIPVTAEVYAFPSVENFLQSRKKIDELEGSWMRYYAEKDKVATDKLTKLIQADIKFQSKENITFLQLPQNLPEGLYLIQLWYENHTKLEQVWVQSTNLSGYVSVGKEQTVVWINTLGKGPAPEARVRIINDGSEYSTSDNGVAEFSTPKIFFDHLRHYVVVTGKEQQLLVLPVDRLDSRDKPDALTVDDYWYYLYHERYLYKSDDTVNFWGVIKNRNTGQAPSTITVSINQGYGTEKTYLKTETTPQPNGSFIGNIKLPNLPEGWYSLSISVNDLILTATSFQVIDFIKPDMKIEVSSDKKAIFAGDSVNYTSRITFFDGTPVKDTPINIYESRGGKSTEIKTDNSGSLTYSYNSTYSNNYRDYSRYEGVTFNPAISKQEKIEGYGSVKVFGSRLMLSTTAKEDGDKASFTSTVNKVVLDDLNSGKSSNYRGDPVKNQKVHLKITKTWWESKQKGTYYDFIEKITRPMYDFISHTEDIADTDINTNDSGNISYEFTMEKQKSYHAEITVADENNHQAVDEEYFYYYQSTNSSYEEHPSTELTLNNKEKTNYSVGDPVSYSVTYNNQPYPLKDSTRFLFTITNRGRQDAVVSDKPEFTFSFAEKHIPNIYVSAVVFTGNGYDIPTNQCSGGRYECYYQSFYESHFIDGQIIFYKSEDSKLNLTITSDADKYQPGAEVKIKAVARKKDQPAANTQVNLVLVDQALAAMNAVIEPSVLTSLYKTVPSYIYYNYSSHIPLFVKPPQAEMGGGGGDRDLFKDTAYFSQAITNENGEASFTFSLPDNITSWIVYAQAVNDKMEAGQTESSIIATKDFFVTSQFPKEYLAADTPILTASSFGINVPVGAKINYETTFSRGDSEIKKLQSSGVVYKNTLFTFPELSAGEYQVKVHGKYQDKNDGIILPFNVIDTRFSFENQVKKMLAGGEEITSLGIQDILNQPIHIVIADEGKGKYFDDLAEFCYYSGNRLEKQLAKVAAQKILSANYNWDKCSTPKNDLAKFQSTDGGLSQVIWGGSNLETTVWSTVIDPTFYNKEKLVSYLEDQYNQPGSGSIQQIMAAWALTNSGKPMLNNLQNLAADAATYDEKVLSALALAANGDVETGRNIYYSLLADYGYSYSPYIRIQAEEKQSDKTDQYLKATGLALLLGSYVDKQYNQGLYTYLRDYRNQASDLVFDLGDMAFITEELSKLPKENTAIYFKAPGKEVTKEFIGEHLAVFSLDPADKDQFILKVTKGKAESTMRYFVAKTAFNQFSSDKRLILKRTYMNSNNAGASINPGDIVRVTLDFDLDKTTAPMHGYTITDYLPSGLTYLNNPEMYGLKAKGWISQAPSEPNILVYHFYNSTWWQQFGEKQIIYYARANSSGKFIAEPAVMQSREDLSVFQTVPETSLEIIQPQESN